MKLKTALFVSVMISVNGDTFSQSKSHYDYIPAADLSAEVRTPTEVNFLQGRGRQRKPTWTLVETGHGDSTLYAGYLTEVKKGKALSIYRVAGTTFTLPTAHYYMEDSILRTRKGKKIECLLVEFEPCFCDRSTSIVFGPDSISRNTEDPYKLVLETDQVVWRREGNRLVPGISMAAVDSLDANKQAVYGLVIVTDEGAACEIFWLHQADHEGDVKTHVYEAAFSEGLRFERDGDTHTCDGRIINKIMVITDAPPQSDGDKKLKHKRRARN